MGESETNDFDKPLTSKNEFSAEESGLLEKNQKYATDRHQVRCPKRNFNIATTSDCFECGSFQGFFPRDRDQPISNKNLWSLCKHIMGREVNYIPKEHEIGD